MVKNIYEAIQFIQTKTSMRPPTGVILGSGLGSFAAEIKAEIEIPYADIPHFPVSTVEGHQGKLIFGHIDDKPVVAMAGRFHFYEGYEIQDVVFPVQVMKFLGVKNLLVSNAAGATNLDYIVGDLMVITDHISLFAPNPLVGRNDPDLGPRFPDMSEPYKKKLINLSKEIAKKNNISLREGVYVGVTGPTFETRAEYKMIRVLGGDAVGMSTVQEVIIANHMGMSVFGISVISDVGIRHEENIITHEEVLKAASEAEPKLTLIFKEMVRQL